MTDPVRRALEGLLAVRRSIAPGSKLDPDAVEAAWIAAERALAAADTVQPTDRWARIETAPRDGTRILVWTENGVLELSDWYSLTRERFEEVGDGLYRRTVETSYEGWNSNTFIWWMPLPEPPALTQDRAP